MNAPRVLMTGATGSFGRHLAVELLDRDCELVLVVRGRDGAEARRRAFTALGSMHPRIRVVRGDITADGLAFGPADAAIARSADIVVHAAATTEFGLRLADARRVNVEGTRNVLALCERMPDLAKLVHVSTAFVAGKRCGRVLEPQLEHNAGFVNGYDRSKNEAERLVRSRASAPLAILRPSVVTGPDAGTSALWFVLRLIERGLLPVLPGAPASPLDLIPAADAAVASADLVLAPKAAGTFHVASGDASPALTDVVRVGAGRGVRFVDRLRFGVELERLRQRNPRMSASYQALATFIELLTYPKTFDTSRAEAALGRKPCAGNPLEALVPGTKRIGSVAR